MRIKVLLADGLLKLGSMHPDWGKIWFEVPSEVSTLGELLRVLFSFISWPTELPSVRVTCEGFFMATSAPTAVLREGDCLLLDLFIQTGMMVPTVQSSCLS